MLNDLLHFVTLVFLNDTSYSFRVSGASTEAASIPYHDHCQERQEKHEATIQVQCVLPSRFKFNFHWQ